MPTEIVIEAEDRPGTIAALGELLGAMDVPLAAAAAFTHGGTGYLHFVVEEADHAIEALRKGGWRIVTSREVMSVSLDDTPGELGRFARRLADAGVNITALYMAGEGAGDKHVIVAVDDLSQARRGITQA